MDGLALLKILRATPKYEDTSVVVLTGSGDNAYEQQAVDKKVNGFLTKPVSSQ
ncbi:MAG: response regulator [Chloroflexi bacterium]|nr:response regulator [Chloroflexota bacterium]